MEGKAVKPIAVCFYTEMWQIRRKTTSLCESEQSEDVYPDCAVLAPRLVFVFLPRPLLEREESER